MKKFCLSYLFFALISVGFLSAEDEAYEFKGIHFLASYCDCDHEALIDVDALKDAMMAAVQECGATVLSSEYYVFPPHGLTMVILLSESHASIHTYPEHNACFVDLFTCGNKCSAEKFDAALKKYLKPSKVNEKVFLRDSEIENLSTKHYPHSLAIHNYEKIDS